MQRLPWVFWPSALLSAMMGVLIAFGGVPPPTTQGQGPATPAVTLSTDWQWVGGEVTLSASGLTPSSRAFVFLLAGVDPADTPTCDVVAEASQVADGLVPEDGAVAFTVVVKPPFVIGDFNYLCVMDNSAERRGAQLEPQQLRVVPVTEDYRIRLEIDSIRETPDGVYLPLGPMPADFSVADGRHWDNWNLPQVRGFGDSVEAWHVSNLDVAAEIDPALDAGVSASHGSAIKKAVSFTTGDTGVERFRLREVVVHVGANANNLVARLHRDSDAATDGPDTPGVALGTLQQRGSADVGRVTFVASGITLDANADYWLVFESSQPQGNAQPTLRVTTDGDDAGDETTFGVVGWTIGDAHYLGVSRGDVMSWSKVAGGRTLRVRLNVLRAPDRAIVITPHSTAAGPLSVREGRSLSYWVRLNSPPSSSVTVAVAQDDALDASLAVSSASLTFTTADWDTAKRVELEAAEDEDTVDDSASFIHTASGGGYDGIAAVVHARSVDNDVQGSFGLDRSVSPNPKYADDLVALIFTRELDPSSLPAAADFTVSVDGEGRDVRRVGIDGRVVTLTLARAAHQSQTVLVSYTKPAEGGLRDWAASPNYADDLAATPAAYAPNALDSVPPEVLRIEVVGLDQVRVVLSEDMDPSANDARGFQLRIRGASANLALDSATPVVIEGSSITLNLAAILGAGDASRLTVSYAPVDDDAHGSAPRDLAGNRLAGFTHQEHAVHARGDSPLLTTIGSWYRCEDGYGGKSFILQGVRLGCVAEEREDSVDAEKVYLEKVEYGAESIHVPGDNLVFQLDMSGSDLGVRGAGERYVVYWGPVDLWMLGGTGGVSVQDFVIQDEHAVGLNQRLVTEQELAASNGVLTVDIPRSSANYGGDTFVAIVPCNDDYLEGKFSGVEFRRAQRSLVDCHQVMAKDSNMPISGREPYPPNYEGAHYFGGVTQAWAQHSPLSGLGLSCQVIIAKSADPEAAVYTREIICRNDLAHSVSRAEYDDCMSVLRRRVGSDAEIGTRVIKCGMGHYENPFPMPAGAVWASTRYNSARSFYGFVIDWQRGFMGVDRANVCDVDLLPYSAAHLPTRYAYLGGGAREWLTGEFGGEVSFNGAGDADCVAAPAQSELEVGFYTPQAGHTADEIDSDATLPRPAWTEDEVHWHNQHPVHFVVYVTGAPAELDTGVPADGWKPYALKTWDVRESAPYNRPRGLTRLGVWYPDDGGGDENSEDGEERLEQVGITLPSMRSMNNGKRLTISRDYAGDDGVVRLFVVPCVPLYGDNADVELGNCEDLPARAGGVSSVDFIRAGSRTGPFEYDRVAGNIYYSLGITLVFRSGPTGAGAERGVSMPDDVVEPSAGCGIVSQGSGSAAYWPEVTVRGGDCEVNNLAPVPVTVSQASGARVDNLVFYTTGGRSANLERVRLRRASADYDERASGRLGLRKTTATLDAGASHVINVSPDLADQSGEVWIVAYSCGSAETQCANVSTHRDPPVFDVFSPSAFVIVVKFTSAGLAHVDQFDDLGLAAPVCQGDDCDPEVPVYRVETSPDDDCVVSGYGGGWLPDRVVRGGGCSPDGLGDVSVAFNSMAGKRLTVFITGGGSVGYEDVQVRRAGSPFGRAGLDRVELDDGGSVLVQRHMADDAGRVLVLAYLCSDTLDVLGVVDASACPTGRDTTEPALFAVDRRPMFQVLVEYNPEQLLDSSLRICRGDSCIESYPLGPQLLPAGDDCSVTAVDTNGRVRWSKGLFAGGACQQADLSDAYVGINAAQEAGSRLTVYVTGGRSPGLEKVRVKSTADADDGVDNRSGWGFDYLDVEPLFASSRAAARPPAVIDGKAWLVDGISPLEQEGINYLSAIGGAAVTRVGAMPFLDDDVDAYDVLALRALARMSRNGGLGVVLDHSRFADGIEDGLLDGDDDRLLVIGARTVLTGSLGSSRPMVTDAQKSLAQQRMTAGYRVVRAQSAGGVPVRVLSLDDQHAVTAAAVAEHLDLVHDRMGGDEFPVAAALVYVDDASVIDGADAVNFGIAVSLRPEHAGEHLRALLVHEVAHYYWWGASSLWIDEGMASALEVLDIGDVGLDEPTDACVDLRTLDAANPAPFSEVWACHYSLGQALFLDLHAGMGEAEFNAGIRRLHTRIDKCRVREGCGDIDDVRAAFPNQATLIARHYGTQQVETPSEDGNLGRMGLREHAITLPAGGEVQLPISPDLADATGNVWVFGYVCGGSAGDAGCESLPRPARNGYDLPKGPDFTVQVQFNASSGLSPAELQQVCRGSACDAPTPWLREEVLPVTSSVCPVPMYDELADWPDRVMRCVFHEDVGTVQFGDGAGRHVVYVTGGAQQEYEDIQIRGVTTTDGVSQLGKTGLRLQNRSGPWSMTLDASHMADDDGNVWALVYRCDDNAGYGGSGCPHVGPEVRPSYNVPIRPAFIVHAQFLAPATATNSSLFLGDECDAAARTCLVVAQFRDGDGAGVDGLVSFAATGGYWGEGFESEVVLPTVGGEVRETLRFPPGVDEISVTAVLDGVRLTREFSWAGFGADVQSIRARIHQCAGDGYASCHDGALAPVTELAPGDWYVVGVRGYDDLDGTGKVLFDTADGSRTDTFCADAHADVAEFQLLEPTHSAPYGYGSGLISGRGYAGCAVRLSASVPPGSVLGVRATLAGGRLSDMVTFTVVEPASPVDLVGALVLEGPAALTPGETGDYLLSAQDQQASPLALMELSDTNCVELTLTGALSIDGLQSVCVTDIPVDGHVIQVTVDPVVCRSSRPQISARLRGRFQVARVMVVAVEPTAASCIADPEDSEPDGPDTMPEPTPTASGSGIAHIAVALDDAGQLATITWDATVPDDARALHLQMRRLDEVDAWLLGCDGYDDIGVRTSAWECLMDADFDAGIPYFVALWFDRGGAGGAYDVETLIWTWTHE